MLTDIDYSKKEISIFEGLIDLLGKGRNPYTIRVAEIAQAANIGKGTIYDYFSSKEEAISKAILYYMDRELKTAYCRLKSKDNFKDRFYELLLIVKDSFQGNLSIYNKLISTGRIKEFYVHLVDIECEMIELLDNANKIIVDDLIEMGTKEGLIRINENPYYMSMAVQGAISAFAYYIGKKDRFKKIEIQEAMDLTYKILLKTLN